MTIVLVPHGTERLFVISQNAITALNEGRMALALRALIAQHQLDDFVLPSPPLVPIAVTMEDLLVRRPVEEVLPPSLWTYICGGRSRGGAADPRCVRCAGTGTSRVDAGRRRVPAHRCPACRARSG